MKKKKCEGNDEFEQLKTVLRIFYSWAQKRPFKFLKYAIFIISLFDPGLSGIEQKSGTIAIKVSVGDTFKLEGSATYEGTTISEGATKNAGNYIRKNRLFK